MEGLLTEGNYAAIFGPFFPPLTHAGHVQNFRLGVHKTLGLLDHARVGYDYLVPAFICHRHPPSKYRPDAANVCDGEGQKEKDQEHGHVLLPHHEIKRQREEADRYRLGPEARKDGLEHPGPERAVLLLGKIPERVQVLEKIHRRLLSGKKPLYLYRGRGATLFTSDVGKSVIRKIKKFELKINLFFLYNFEEGK